MPLRIDAVDQITHLIPDHDDRLRIARAFASFELGDAYWADQIVALFLGEDEIADEAAEAWS